NTSGTANGAVAPAVPTTEAATLLPETQGPTQGTHPLIVGGALSGVGPVKRAPHRRRRHFDLSVLAASLARLADAFRRPGARSSGRRKVAASFAVLIAVTVLIATIPLPLPETFPPEPKPHRPLFVTPEGELTLAPAAPPTNPPRTTAPPQPETETTPSPA